MSTITTINGTDTITSSRTVLNTNISNLNTDKIETSVLDTDTALTANSDLKVATQKAVKAYMDAIAPTILFAGVRAYQSAAQSIGGSGTAVLNFGAEAFDTDSFHDIATNNSRLTVPTGKAGKYAIGASIAFGGGVVYGSLQIRLNGATIIALGGGNQLCFNTLNGSCSITTVYNLAVADYIEVLGGQSDSASQSTVGDLRVNLWMYRIG